MHLGYDAAGHSGNPGEPFMHKRLLIITCFTGWMLGACSIGDWGLVHRIDVQQGNVISQDALNQLTPGMTRRQVQYVIGSPMVADTFHKDRWDYIYRMETGKGKVSEEHVTLFFHDDTLASISGSMHPQDSNIATTAHEQVTLVVPPEDRTPPGLLSRFWHWITFREIDKTGGS
jgi:outer membrane protein assembly factor BamE